MNNASVHCPKCGSNNVTFQLVQEQKKRGFFKFIFHLIIKFILLIFNLILWLISLLIPKARKTKTSKYAICQNCGYSWKVKN